MPNIISEYIGGFIGNFVQLAVFVIAYNYFIPITMNWTLIVLIAVALTLVLAPISYIIKSKQEEQALTQKLRG